MRECPQCRGPIKDQSLIRCPRCNCLLLQKCGGNCSNCQSKTKKNCN